MSHWMDDLVNAKPTPIPPGEHEAKMLDLSGNGQGKAEIIGGEHDGKQVEFDLMGHNAWDLSQEQVDHIMEQHDRGTVYRPDPQPPRRYWGGVDKWPEPEA